MLDKLDRFLSWYHLHPSGSVVEHAACHAAAAAALLAGLFGFLVTQDIVTAIGLGAAVNYALAYRVWRWSVRRHRTGGSP